MPQERSSQQYQTFISAQASQTLNSKGWYLFIACLIVLGVYDYLNIEMTQWKTAPAILFIIASHLWAKYFNGPNWQKIAPYAFDLICVSIILSSCYLVTVCFEIKDFVLDSAPLQISLLGTSMIGFHFPKRVLIRNLSFGVLSIASLYALGSTKLLFHSLGQIIIGTGCGTALYYILFDRLLKNKFEISVHLSEKSLTLRNVLEGSKYPHQKIMIENGFKENETLPVGQFHDALIMKLDVINSSKVRNPQYPAAFSKFCELIESDLLSDYCLVSDSPLVISGRGFFVKRVGDAAIISIGFPFLPKSGMSMEDCAANVLEKIELYYTQCMTEIGEPELSYCIGVVYGQVCGEFSGKRMNYDINGMAMNLAERYETLRKGFDRLNVEQPTGNFITAQDKAIQFLRTLKNKDFIRVRCDSIRDDPGADHFFIIANSEPSFKILSTAS